MGIMSAAEKGLEVRAALESLASIGGTAGSKAAALEDTNELNGRRGGQFREDVLENFQMFL